jgi:hypothetical protein
VSADLINLRRVKKLKARNQADKIAEANRQKFGRTKSEKKLSNFEKSREVKILDGQKRDV